MEGIPIYQASPATSPDLPLEWSGGKRLALQQAAIISTRLQATLPETSEGQPTAYVDPQVVVSTLAGRRMNRGEVRAVDRQDDYSEFRDEDQDDSVERPGEGDAAESSQVLPVDVAVDASDLITLSKTAVVKLEYDEGIPTVEGLPFWNRLPTELTDYFDVFKTYRDMKQLTGHRSMAQAAQDCFVDPQVVQTLAKLYHWRARVKAYDAYLDRLMEQERAFHTRRMENRHRETAEKLFEASAKHIDSHKDEMSIKEALEGLKQAAQLERLSLGLPMDKPASEVAGNGGPVLNLTQNTINAGGNPQAARQLAEMAEILTILNVSGAMLLAQKPAKNEVIDITPKEQSAGSHE